MLEIRIIMNSGNRVIFHSDIPNTALNRERLSGYCDDYAKRLGDKVWGVILIDTTSGYSWEL